ncbi:transposase InsO family protein [Kitasatospora sp. MAA19]|uniref:integrase core domain-containing protein n=1 Tax=unclassified Kitasatospora TaxID=2633591 RepID=UPI002475A91D|nr:integrase core domain-containing protein [Kitasatospora sp. MAA19]MDH6709518.1 transposase InsO family protein [Kitasatospora sp. MAA19]
MAVAALHSQRGCRPLPVGMGPTPPISDSVRQPYIATRYGRKGATERLVEVGASASVGSVADSYDNAMAEALNGTFKAELIEHQGPWRDFDEVERAVFQWVAWYNSERLHSALGYMPPDEYEQAYWTGLEQHPQVA